MERPLFGKILSTPTLKNEYLRTLSNLFNTYFSSTRLFPHIDSVANVIRPFVYEDSRKQYSNQQFETNIPSNLTSSVGGPGVGLGGNAPGLKSFIAAREANVHSQLSALGLTSAERTRGSPADYALEQNYPNPFNPVTSISFALPSESTVRLEVFGLIGQLLRTLIDDRRPAGKYVVTFDGSQFPSGIYFYKLTAGTFQQTRRMTLIK
jgi:hypothetical protein